MAKLPHPSRAAVSLASVVFGVLAASAGASCAFGVGIGLIVLGALAIVLGLLAGWE